MLNFLKSLTDAGYLSDKGSRVFDILLIIVGVLFFIEVIAL